jgi:hypothetical protein
VPIRDVGEIEHAIEVFARAGNGGLMVLPDVSSTNYRDLIIAARSLTGFKSFASSHLLPMVNSTLIFNPDTAPFAHLFWQPVVEAAPAFDVEPGHP